MIARVRRRLAGVALAAGVVGGLWTVGFSQTPPPPPDPPRFELEKVVDDVYAAIRTEPPGLLLDANSVFIINDSDVVVVDTNLTPSSARASLAALRELTSKPVSYVINTHWHDDHILGNQVYREAFPDAQFVAHASVSDPAATGAASRRQLVDMAPRMAQQFRLSLEQQKSLTGGSITDEERASYASDADAATRFVNESSAFDVVLPTVTVADRLTLRRGRRTIDILFLGRGHSSSDLVVYLPAERVAITGDLVAAPIPIVGAGSHPLEFPDTLDRLLALGATRFVPGHGPILRDDGYVRRERALVAAIKRQVEASVAQGDSLEDTRQNVRLDAFRSQFAGASQHLGYIFDNHVTQPGIAAAYRDAMARR